ncbi:hypothetical protein NGRA_1297 [Nosema granulosis]|uniref:Uncharacterized protein n=1 Tax=Nosema granulosis TaxID=83296 RepID=A0A9P6GZ99_9MICR|nr:hypothetical protein NGRA_1297 [Nosema granulosis]
MIIEIKNRDFFLSVLSTFLNKKQIDITVSEDSMLIECIEICRTYVNLDRSIFEADETREKFSVDPSHLHKSCNILKTNEIHILEDHILLRNEISYIKIPLLSTIDHQYEEVGEVHTKFMIHSKNIQTVSLLQGLVRYEIENDTLFIRRIAHQVFEEIEMRDVDFIEVGELSFSCNNSWSVIFEDISRSIQGTMFFFSDCFLSVQLLFKDKENVYYEIQIPKALVE